MLDVTHRLVARSAWTPWFAAVAAVADGRYQEAANGYEAIGSLPDALEVRLLLKPQG